MTREDAIKNIKEHCYFANLIPQAKEALEMAIKALEKKSCEDCISREEMWRAYHKMIDSGKTVDVYDAIKNLPSVSTQTKIGKLIYRKEEDTYRCSLCSFPCHKDNMGAIPTRYCAECGAIMQEVEE